jgi:two-component system, cell cycle response regulator DivK
MVDDQPGKLLSYETILAGLGEKLIRANIGNEGQSFRKPPRQKGVGKVITQRSLILIVDDFKDDREMYAHYLSRSGFRVSLASDGQEALDNAYQLLPDVILMDLSLPQIGGWEAIRQLKANDKTKHIPIVVLTARAFVSASAVGSEGCLIKPCQPDDLLVEVVRVLEMQKKKPATVSAPRAFPAQRR